MPDTYSISGATIVTDDGPKQNSSVEIKGKRLSRIGGISANDLRLDPGMVLFPALINVHDHLRGTYLPRVGPPAGVYYLKCSNWEQDLRSSDVVKERSNLSEEDCYFLGGYKNLLSGVITVNDHFPHEINERFIPLLPLRVIGNYTLAHEASSHSLDWGEGIEAEHAKAKKKNYPFIIHLEEGFDEEYQRGIELLEKLSSLDEYDVLIHCLGFSEVDIEKTRNLGCTVAWCPASNFFMFNVTCKIRKILTAGINCAIGTDSVATGSINLLEEIRFARRMYKKMYGEVLEGKRIFDMVTINPARAFRMEKDIGSIEVGKLADLLVIRPNHPDPYEALVETRIEDIELMVWEGRPVYGARGLGKFFKLDPKEYTDIRIRGREKFVKGDPAGLLRRIQEKIGYKKVFDFMPLDD